MIECILTIDYEIYGNGQGSLKELIYEPARKLRDILDQGGARIVLFVEAVELESIEAAGSNAAIDEVKRQVHEMHREGHEIALHLHPQWHNARCQHGNWKLDFGQYNLCTLPKDKIAQIVDAAILYLRGVLALPDFTPLSFRAGNWLFQPARAAAEVLSARGIRIDSSVFKGGVQHQYGLDYRRAHGNGHFWRFRDDVNIPDHRGDLLELPIYTQMMPFWKMATPKRIGLQRKGASGKRTAKQLLYSLQDMARFRQPMKLDFCRMNINELTGMMDKVIKADEREPATFKPIVAIGHTKDLVDFSAVQSFLAYLKERGIATATFAGVYDRCRAALHE